MISYIEGPHDDEPLFSLLARIYHRLIGPSRTQFARHIFGNPRMVIPFDFPCGIGALTQSIGGEIGLSEEQLIQRHTMFPIAAFLMSAERSESVKIAMLGNRASAMNLIKWHRKRAQDGQRRLYFCTKCREQDILHHGHTWWRRVHQAPGVICCPMHSIPLDVSQFVIGQFWKLDYPLADDAVSTRKAPLPDGIDLIYARDVRWMLRNPPIPINPERLRRLYQNQAEMLGLFRSGQLQRAEFLARFYAQRTHAEWEERALLFNHANTSAWPAVTIKNKANHQSVQMHLLVMRFLNLSIGCIHERLALIKDDTMKVNLPSEAMMRTELHERWSDPNWSLQQICSKLGIGVSRVHRLAGEEGLPIPRLPNKGKLKRFRKKRARHRQLFLRGEDSSRPNDWRTVKLWISRFDSDWYQKRKPLKKSAPKGARMDWGAREQDYIAKLPQFVSRVRAERPFRKISLTALISLLPFGASMGTRLKQKMPRLYKEMRRVRETAEEYILRRIQVIRQLNPDLRPYQIRERAAVPPQSRNPKIMKALGYDLVGTRWISPESAHHPLYGIVAAYGPRS